MSRWVFEVAGKPRPKGSMVCQGGRQHHLVESVAGSKPWKLEMVRQIRDQLDIRPLKVGNRVTGWAGGWVPLQGPITVQALFCFERCGCELDYPMVPNDHGDLDKLCRNLGDALEMSGLIKNDAQIVQWIASKLWDTEARACVRVETL